MKMKEIKINLFAIVYYGAMLILLATGLVSPWVAVLIILSGVEVNITFTRP